MKTTKPVLELQDYFLTGDQFKLVRRGDSEILETQPVPEDLGRYYESEDYLSHDDSKGGFFAYCYNLAKRFNLGSKSKLVATHLGTGKHLDIGAGIGDLVHTLNSRGLNSVGFEPSPRARDVAKSKGVTLLNNLELVASNSINVVSMYHVLEHVTNLEHQIAELERIMKKDAILILALPNYDCLDAKWFKKYWAGYDAPRHLFHFNQNAVEQLFSQRFELIDKKPMLFDSFYVSILSARYKKIPLAFLYGTVVGLLSNIAALFTKNASSITYVLKKRF
ncbi:MAG: class I SAM-dependent methyltransferase [Nonlabens sp.]